MASEREFELLDDYLANRMPAGDRASFEKSIEGNVELKNELTLQKGLVEGLQKARVSELKGILNKIPVSAVGTGSSAIITKAAMLIGVSALVSTGLYFMVAKKEGVKTEQRAELIENKNTEEPTEPINPVEELALVATDEEEKTSTKRAERKKQKGTASKETVAEPKIEVFDPSTELEETSSEPNEEILSDDKLTSVSRSTIAVEVDSNNRKFDFHYKLENDQLTLYGEFERNLYEILEFISEEKRTAFLYHKQNYYVLKQTNKATILTPVKDPVLLKKLREHRAGK